MKEKKFDPERDLREWAEALNAVADLQHEIVTIRSQAKTMLVNFDWLDPFQAIVFGTLRTFPDRAKEPTMFEAAQGLKRTATNALAELREETQKHRGE